MRLELRNLTSRPCGNHQMEQLEIFLMVQFLENQF